NTITSYASYTLMTLKDYQKTEELVSLGLRLFPKSVDLLTLKADTLINKGEYQEALDLLILAEKLISEYTPYLVPSVMRQPRGTIIIQLKNLIAELQNNNTFTYFLQQTNLLSLDQLLPITHYNHNPALNYPSLKMVSDDFLSKAKKHYETGLSFREK